MLNNRPFLYFSTPSRDLLLYAYCNDGWCFKFCYNQYIPGLEVSRATLPVIPYFNSLNRFTAEAWVCEYGCYDNLTHQFIGKPCGLREAKFFVQLANVAYDLYCRLKLKKEVYNV